MKYALIVLSLFICVTVSAATTRYPFDVPSQTIQFQTLLKNLRCLVCQNQDLADSNAGLANDLRDEIYQKVKAGESSVAIQAYLTSRYGDFILFKPPLKSTTLLLWFGPAMLLGCGFFLLWWFGIRDSVNE